MSNQTHKITPHPDPAAVLGIAMSLHSTDNPDISSAYQGADQFMRECMRVGEVFERWACRHVAFDELNDVWPYMLHDKFGAAVESSGIGILNLGTFGEAECLKVARELKLYLNP